MKSSECEVQSMRGKTSMKKYATDTLPLCGVGLGHRDEISDAIFKHEDHISCLEIVTERYMSRHADLYALRKLSERFKVIPHGVSLSIGSDHINDEHLIKIKQVCDVINADYYSEHLCITRTSGINTGHLCPMQYNEDMLATVIKNVEHVQSFIERPLVLENITYSYEIPNSTMTQQSFINELVNETGCGLLLDVTNVHTNAHNNQFNPFQFLEQMPLENIVHVHLAGGQYTKSGELIDSHNMAIELRSFELFDFLNKIANIKTVIIEHDSNFPKDFSVFIEQLAIANAIFKKQTWESDYHSMLEKYQ